MALKVAIQMDPIGPINIDADSTFRIALEAQARGHQLFYYTPDKLAYREGRIVARGWPLEVRRVKGNHFTLGDETEVDLAEWDVVWLRQDPPFDMGYITTTHLLERIHPKTLVVNSDEIREALQEPVNSIVDAVRSVLERTPPELSADIVDKGIVLSGGSAQLKNLDVLLREETGLPVMVCENPQLAVVLGTGRVLDELSLLREIALK